MLGSWLYLFIFVLCVLHWFLIIIIDVYKYSEEEQLDELRTLLLPLNKF